MFFSKLNFVGLACLHSDWYVYPMIKKLICIILVANDLLEPNLFAFGLMCSLKLKLVGLREPTNLAMILDTFQNPLLV